MGQAELQLVVKNEDVLDEGRIAEIKAAIKEEFEVEVDYKVILVGNGRSRLIIKAETDSVFVLEVFMQLLGNIRVFQKILNYRRE